MALLRLRSQTFGDGEIVAEFLLFSFHHKAVHRRVAHGAALKQVKMSVAHSQFLCYTRSSKIQANKNQSNGNRDVLDGSIALSYFSTENCRTSEL